jgi:hypothetical protein
MCSRVGSSRIVSAFVLNLVEEVGGVCTGISDEMCSMARGGTKPRSGSPEWMT